MININKLHKIDYNHNQPLNNTISIPFKSQNKVKKNANKQNVAYHSTNEPMSTNLSISLNCKTNTEPNIKLEYFFI